MKTKVQITLAQPDRAELDAAVDVLTNRGIFQDEPQAARRFLITWALIAVSRAVVKAGGMPAPLKVAFVEEDAHDDTLPGERQVDAAINRPLLKTLLKLPPDRMQVAIKHIKGMLACIEGNLHKAKPKWTGPTSRMITPAAGAIMATSEQQLFSPTVATTEQLTLNLGIEIPPSATHPAPVANLVAWGLRLLAELNQRLVWN